MKAKLILWFSDPKALSNFIVDFIDKESGLHLDIYSANSYKMATIPDVTAYTLEQNQLRFNAGGKGFTLNATSILRHEIAFYEVEDR